MLSFHQITQKFQSFKTLNGLAVFDRYGQFVDTSLPLSDELCEEIGNLFKEMVVAYHAKQRKNNRFIVEINGRVFLFAEYAEGAFLFMVRDTSEIDAILGAFTHLYCMPSNNRINESSLRIEALVPPIKKIELPGNGSNISKQLNLVSVERPSLLKKYQNALA